jgi:murein DD-endopeptidase MepM/ murein hydrolase activator NlpD
VRGYGSGEGGYHLAMDIMGERGSDVLAAADGIVGYAGHEERGYGRIVILVHAGGWVTMYAHNDSNYVVPGQRVSRGQAIASLGNTGISRGPHVHFEFMHGGRNCDPAPLFRPGIRHRWGGISDLVPTGWMEADARPKSVACDRRRRHPRSRYGDPSAQGSMDLSAKL